MKISERSPGMIAAVTQKYTLQGVLGKPIPCPVPRAMQDQMPGADKRGQVILNRAAIRTSCVTPVTEVRASVARSADNPVRRRCRTSAAAAGRPTC